MRLILASVKTVALGVTLFFGGAVWASRDESHEPAFLEGSLGYYDIDRRRYPAGEGMMVYRLERPFWSFRLFAAALGTSRGSVFAGGGVAYDVFLGRVTITPSFAPGAYASGSGLDLGYPLEFRSQLEASYRLGSRARVGLAFSHMSNAHLGDRNPGVETLLLNVSVPLGGR